MGGGAGRALRPPSRRGSTRLGLAAGLLAALLSAWHPAEAARLVGAQGSQADGYGRIVLTFDAPVAVKAKLFGAVLVLSFGEQVAAGPEKIAATMPSFVSLVRRDPDGTALRLALQRPVRTNVQQAGEQVFVDLLPESWAGLPPALPPEVVADLARRAREAEAALHARSPAPAPRTLPLELATNPSRTRLSLKLPSDARSVFAEEGAATRLTLPGAWRIDEQAARGRLKPETGQVTVENGADGARLVATPAKGVTLVAERDGDTVTIDFLPAKTAKPEAQPHVEAKAPEEARPDIGLAPAAPVESKPEQARAEPEPPASKPETREAAAGAVQRRAGSGLVFPFQGSVPAALFERGGIATLVFETSETVAVPSPGASGLAPIAPPRRVGGFTVLRFAAPDGRLLDLLPVSEPRGWELVAGRDLAPSESLVVQRLGAPKGRLDVGLKLPDPGGAVWLDLDGERIAVVTARGTRPASVAKPQRFVDFELLTSRAGIAVLALADDLAVRPDIDGVVIDREGGLSVSGVARTAEPPVVAAGDLAIDRAAWEAARRGDVRTGLRELLDAVVRAERGDRTQARLAYVRMLMANGFDAEATGALGAASAEDPVLESDPRTALMRGILAASMGRADDAEKLLSVEALTRNPEARLWRGYARASAARWAAADADLHAGEAVVARYPEDVAAAMRAAMAEVAAELSDWNGAAIAAKAAAPGASPLVRDRLALLRARVDEAKGGTKVALEAYEALAQQAERPVQAEAELRAIQLSLATKAIDPTSAIDRLEALKITWHGGQTEVETLAALGRLYEKMGHWRQVFATARRANTVAPDAPATRALHEAAQALFEDLYLGERSDKIGGIEALALYFDYKDFAPIGRRADEIVRRLADRLVALDLLESADELLQHQVEHRLAGAARASVAARLAAIRLMEGKPLEALQTLDASHLPELGEDLRRARALLRARALSDLTRTDLALETIEGETGADAERLRADILWAARRWREAGEAHEAILGEAWRSATPLDEAARSDAIRAALAYGLAGEAIGLERLKAKFAPAMAETADARTFALLTRTDASRNPAFREIARKATTAETLAAFLAEYRKRYPQDSVPERGKGDSRAEAAAEPGAPG